MWDFGGYSPMSKEDLDSLTIRCLKNQRETNYQMMMKAQKLKYKKNRKKIPQALTLDDIYNKTDKFYRWLDYTWPLVFSNKESLCFETALEFLLETHKAKDIVPALTTSYFLSNCSALYRASEFPVLFKVFGGESESIYFYDPSDSKISFVMEKENLLLVLQGHKILKKNFFSSHYGPCNSDYISSATWERATLPFVSREIKIPLEELKEIIAIGKDEIISAADFGRDGLDSICCKEVAKTFKKLKDWC